MSGIAPIPNAESSREVGTQECEFCKEISEAGRHSKPPKLTPRGKIMLGVAGAVVAGVGALMAPFVFPGLRKIALPYIPASEAQVKNVMKALSGRSGRLIDIGSGDGRITLTAAQNGFQAYGVELNMWLVLYSKWKAWTTGLSGQAHFFRKDLWKTDLSGYQNVVIFGVETMMAPLEQKLGKEMKTNTSIVACRFPLPSWEPVLTLGEGVDTVWLYSIPQSVTKDQLRHSSGSQLSNVS